MWPHLFSGNYAPAAEEIHKLCQCGGITALDLCVTRAISQIPSQMLGRNTAHTNGLQSEPSTKTRRKQNPSVPGMTRVSLFSYQLRKCSNLRSQWTLRRAREDYFVIDDEPHTRLLSSFKGAERANYADLLWITRWKPVE